MKKLMVGLAAVAVLGLMVTPAMALLLKDWDKGENASASISPDFELYIEEYIRISCEAGDPEEFVVKVNAGERGGEGRLDYEVASNFDFRITGSLTPPVTGLPGDLNFLWSASVNGGTTDDGLFTGGQVWPFLDDTANEPAEEQYEAVVAVQIFNLPENPSGDFNTSPGDIESGHYSGGYLTLTVAAQP